MHILNSHSDGCIFSLTLCLNENSQLIHSSSIQIFKTINLVYRDRIECYLVLFTKLLIFTIHYIN